MDLNKLLSYSVESGASDLHLSVGSIPMVRINGTMKPLNMGALKQEDMESILPQVLDEDQMKLFEDNKEIDLSKLIIECRKLMKVKKVELSKIFEDSYKQFPKATMAMHAMAHDGSPIMALVNEGKIVCPIGVKITMNSRGERTEEFVPLMR